MPRRSALIAIACLTLVSLPGTALAVSALTSDGRTNVRSGPGARYSIVAKVGGGSRVEVLGCLEDRSWCRAIAPGARGWISASRLRFVYDGKTGESLDIPVLRFDRRDERRQRRERAGRSDHHVAGRILGEVTDRPGYCYVLDAAGNSVVEPCPDRDPVPEPRFVRILGEVTDRPGYCYMLDTEGKSVVAPCPDRDPVPETRFVRILGEVTDRPGYCYMLDTEGNSVVALCPERE